MATATKSNSTPKDTPEMWRRAIREAKAELQLECEITQSPGQCPSCDDKHPEESVYGDSEVIVKSYSCDCGVRWDEEYSAIPQRVTITRQQVTK